MADLVDFVAPLSGVTVALEQVPDPVFAQKLVGDGAAIDPTSSEVLAPCAGTVSQLHRARHAVAITTSGGLEVLIHVGLDTVSLGGRGFTPLVKLGDVVTARQPLLRFDADLVAREAKSLITVVVVTNLHERRTVTASPPPLLQAGRDVLFTVNDAAGGEVTSHQRGPSLRSQPVTLPNASGLHARPAAVLAQQARTFEAELLLWKGERSANLKSVTSLMGLSTRRGDSLVLEARGPDAQAALDALTKTLAAGAGEAPGEAPTFTTAPPAVAEVKDGRWTGISASPGLALGVVTHLKAAALEVTEAGAGRDVEARRLAQALREAEEQLTRLARGSKAQAGIIGVQRELLEDPELLARLDEPLARGSSAAFAWRQAFEAQAAAFEALDQPLLRERATDVRDVGQRVLALLVGHAPTMAPLPERAVVVTAELTPTQLAGFDASRFVGLISTTGSATSHVAILTRGMGVPALMGVDRSVLSLPEGTEVVLDADAGTLTRAPTDATRAALEQRIAAQTARRDAERAAAFLEGRTRDGQRIEVVANIETPADARRAMEAGAEGVGLLRSEFLFLERETAPSEEEQTRSYAEVAAAVGPARPLVIRTLDVGGDKPLAYLPLGKEENPFLGVRGVRVSLARPELFRAQLRAIVRAAGSTRLHLMFPMVATLAELQAAKGFVAEVSSHATGPVKVGIMVEVPSAVFMAETLAREADFFSIGTNDLTQYVLAMDRGNPQLAKQADGLDPAVLRAIHQTVQGAQRHQRPVAVCGGLASDPLAAPVLVGLGVTELSVSIPSVGPVKSALARWSLAECQALATQALQQPTAAHVRALLEKGVR